MPPLDLVLRLLNPNPSPALLPRSLHPHHATGASFPQLSFNDASGLLGLYVHLLHASMDANAEAFLAC